MNTVSADNIIDFFHGIDLADVSASVDWYHNARTFAEGLADEHSLPVERVSGVIAAFSPVNDWDKNRRDAERFLATGVNVHTAVFMGKARAILAGADILPTLGGLKIQNFHTCIVSAGAEGVCIDRHAIDIAKGLRQSEAQRGKLTPRQYAEAVYAYTEAAMRLSAEGCILTPAEVQAVTWEAWRVIHKGIRTPRA
jgi:hypothetical protein